MTLAYSYGREFVEQTRPILQWGTAQAFVRHLERYWPASKLIDLLGCGHEDAVCVALAGLSFVGTMSECPAIAALLHDDDGLTADLAEHALWSIWFRVGDAEANERLASAVRLISQGDLQGALDLLAGLVAINPGLAEAHHQLSLIHFLRGEYSQAIMNCEATLVLNPWHFGAMATLGHCHVAAGRLNQACAAYQRSLQMHPRLQGVRQAIHQIRSAAPPFPVNSFTSF